VRWKIEDGRWKRLAEPGEMEDGRGKCYFPRNKSGKIRNIYKIKQPVV
jgi:hypothetical protein